MSFFMRGVYLPFFTRGLEKAHDNAIMVASSHFL